MIIVKNNIPRSPDEDGMARWLCNIAIELKKRGHKCYLIGHENGVKNDGEIRSIFSKIIECTLKSKYLSMAYYFLGWDYATRTTYNTCILDAIVQLIKRENIDAIMLCGHGTQVFIPFLKEMGEMPVIMIPLDAPAGCGENGYGGYVGDAKMLINGYMTRKCIYLYNKSNNVIVVSEKDREILVKCGVSAPISVCPMGVNVEYFTPQHGCVNQTRKRVIFTGVLDYEPNVEAVEWLINELYVKYEMVRKGIECCIVGRRPSQRIVKVCEKEGVKMLEDVKDLRLELQKSMVFVAPMHKGTGVKNKVLEAMSMGLPVVGTPLAFNGIDNPRGVVITDRADEMSKAIVELTRNPKKARKMGEMARQYIVKRCGIEKTVDILLNVIDASGTKL